MNDNSYNWSEIQTLITDLQKYTDLDGPNSQTEAITCLCDVLSYPDYIENITLIAILKELKEKLDYYQNNTKIFEREETYTHKVKYLKHLTK